MPERSHTPFALFNRTANPLVRALLRSPFHRPLSSHLALITVTGRRSGRTFTIPVGYRQEGETARIDVGWPERKLWWRNLRQEAPVELVLEGVERTGRARVRGDVETGVVVVVELDPES